MFNNGAVSVDGTSFALGTFLNIEENDVCFFFAGSVIFLNANNEIKAFVFVITRNRELLARYGVIEIFRGKQNEV